MYCHRSLAIVICLLALVILSCSDQQSESSNMNATNTPSLPYSSPTPFEVLKPLPRESEVPNRRPTATRRQPTATRSVTTVKPLHWEMAEAHVESGGSGRVPVFQETELSKRMKYLLSGISRSCGDSDYEVATLSLAAQLTLFAQGIEYSLLDFMEVFHSHALDSNTSCEDTALTSLAVIKISEEVLDKYGY